MIMRPVKSWRLCRLFDGIGPDAVILIGCDPYAGAISMDVVAFDTPEFTGVIFREGLQESLHRSAPDEQPIAIILDGVLADVHFNPIFNRNACPSVVEDHIALEFVFSGKAQPETIVGMVGLIIDEAVPLAEGCLKGNVRAVRSVVVFKEVVIAGYWFKLAAHPGQEKAIASHASPVLDEGIMTGIVGDQEAGRISTEMASGLRTRLIAAAVIGVVFFKSTGAGFVEVKAETGIITGIITSHGQILTVVGQQSIHLVLKVIIDELT